jgi:hypothetical protein
VNKQKAERSQKKQEGNNGPLKGSFFKGRMNGRKRQNTNRG